MKASPARIPLLLLVLATLAGCAGTRPVASTSPEGAAAPPDPVAERLVLGWEEAFQNSRTLAADEPDSVKFLRYQAMLGVIDPGEIPPGQTELGRRAQTLRARVAEARDAAWLRWQIDLAPPPEPRLSHERPVAFTIAPESNERVQKWLDYFTGPGRERFATWMWRSGAYRARMEDILRQEGLPPELVTVVFIESGFNLHAHSRARAVGPWQFIRDTGRRYGLTVNPHRDERRDFDLSTRAAAHYFKDLYAIFGDWDLALAAYNCGEARVFRQSAHQNLDDFWGLSLPRETRDYVPKFHAALTILARPEEYGFSPDTCDPVAFDEVDLPGPVRVAELAGRCGAPVDAVKALNPAWLRSITPADGGPVKARLPPGATGHLSVADLPLVSAAEARAAVSTHRVRRGETLGGIARRYGVSTAALARENRMTTRSVLRVGRVLRLPDGALDRALASDDPPPVRRKATAGRAARRTADPRVRVHVVRQGDSLWSISRRYGVSLTQLTRWNGLTRRSVLKPGQRVRLSG